MIILCYGQLRGCGAVQIWDGSGDAKWCKYVTARAPAPSKKLSRLRLWFRLQQNVPAPPPVAPVRIRIPGQLLFVPLALL